MLKSSPIVEQAPMSVVSPRNRLQPSTMRKIVTHFLRLAMPTRCYACGDVVYLEDAICPSCWKELRFVTDPRCDCCGVMFERDFGSGALCGDCISQKRPYDRLRYPLIYNDTASRIISAFKYHDRLHGARMISQMMHLAGEQLLRECDIIIPIPMHYRRFLQRGYNQAELLAGRLHKYAPQAILLPGALKRIRHTQPQASLSQSRRKRNVRRAFTVSEAHRDKLRGSHVLLIDDVMTTGATIESCCKELRRCDVGKVDVLTFARRVLD